MKRLLSFLFVLAFTQLVFAQRVTLGIGPSFAVGDYGSNDILNDKASQALTGYCVKVSNEFMPGCLFTPTVFIFYNSNSMGGGQIESVFKGVDFIPQNPYSQYGGGVGMHVQTKGEGISVGLSGNIGLAGYRSASFILQDMHSSNYVKIKSNDVYGAVGMVGGFVKIPVAKTVTLNVMVDYMMGKVSYGQLEAESQGMYYYVPSAKESPFRAVTAQLGVSFNL